MKTLAIISRKGGAGKTTLAIHLAIAAEAAGLSTAIFDLDPQASAVLWADRRAGKAPAVVPAQAPRLTALLDQARQQKAGLVILDTAPHADSIASEAAACADLILIPCRPASLDLDAIGASVRLAQTTRRALHVVINAAPAQGSEAAEAEAALASAGVSVSPIVIHQRKAFAAFIQEGRSALEAEPKGKAAGEITRLFGWLNKQAHLLPSEKVKKVAS
jgi:chromosome partitioning protein